MRRFLYGAIFALTIFFQLTNPVLALSDPIPIPEPRICGCPSLLDVNIYASGREDGGGRCVYDIDTFLQDPQRNHLWVEDPDITAQGKADERARQFLFWLLNTGTVDTHFALTKVWGTTRNIVIFFLLLVAAALGVGLIVGQRSSFGTKIKIMPLFVKLGLLFLYVAFSATIIITLIQLSDILMKFFIENLGGKDLFNINFGVVSGEGSYIKFVGCRDLNTRVQEGVNAQLMMLKATNITYYVMGVMLILRKVLLWFLLFVSPVLAMLLPFTLIRNTGWIWIGVFFQWLFYGPLFAIFLGGLATLWTSGIPFIFDFSRVSKTTECNPAGYVYPTAINILYGGPAQTLATCNNGNYVDTFAEYFITLVMLWAATFFPFWLLRIFRDYCCEGIFAMKNILLSMYEETRGGPGPSPSSPTPAPVVSTLGTALQIPKEEKVPVRVKLETREEIKKARTEDITQSLNLKVSRLTDVARFETNRQSFETVQKNLNYLQNPIKAQTPTERQKYMNIRSELFSRAIKEDTTAKQILSTISSSRIEQTEKRQELLQSIPVTHVVSVKVKVPQQTAQAVTSSFLNTASANNTFVSQVAQTTNIPQQSVKNILTSYATNLSKPANQIINSISQQTNIPQEKVTEIISHMSSIIEQSKTIKETAVKERITESHVQRLVESLSTVLHEKETTREQSISSILSESTNISQDRISSVTNSLFQQIVNNPLSQSQIKNETGLDKEQVEIVVNSFVKHLAGAPATIIESVSKETGIEKEKIDRTLTILTQNVKEAKEITKTVAEKEKVNEQELETIVKDQVPAAKKEKRVEESITIPPSVSIDEYEQVKKMWRNQYERGEVPTSPSITSRDAWVKQDIVFITNVLNKLMSDVPEIRQAGLDELGQIIPIFLINKLRGDQLLVYLKAKLEAAKEFIVQFTSLEAKEQEVKESLTEEFVDVGKQKAETQEKEASISDEIKEPS